MLGRLVLLPHAMSVSAESSASEMGVRLSILTQLNESSILLIPLQGKARILAPVQAWHSKYRQRGLALLQELARNNRMIEILPPSSGHSACIHNQCTPELRIAKFCAPSATIASEQCLECCVNVNMSNAILVEEFHYSQLAENIMAGRNILLNHAEWTLSQLEQRVITPLFSHAKHVKVIDRYFGRSLLYGSDYSRPRIRTALKPGYQRGLEWLLSCFHRYSDRAVRSFEVYSGIDRTLSATQRADLRTLMANTVSSLQSRFAPSLAIFLKDETLSQMPHARYLITDQYSVSLDRGIDILLSRDEMRRAGYVPGVDEERVRDLCISQCDASSHEVRVRSLPDL
jgi:hypothetical protein